MAKKKANLDFEQTLERLSGQGFELNRTAGEAGAVLVSRGGVAAVIAAGDGGAVRLLESPGVLIQGEVARLLDRGYQKFFKNSHFELPATAEQLSGVHAFSEALKALIGQENLYNQSLGSTSDLYQYDRLKGRTAGVAAGTRPWESAAH